MNEVYQVKRIGEPANQRTGELTTIDIFQRLTVVLSKYCFTRTYVTQLLSCNKEKVICITLGEAR